MPPQVFAAVAGLILGWFMGRDGDRLINIPAEPFKHGIVMPNFQGLFSNHSLWWALFTTVLTLTLIDGVESLATIPAMTRSTRSAVSRTRTKPLMRWGPNMCSSMACGLTIIPGRSKARQAFWPPNTVGQLLQRLLPDHLSPFGEKPNQHDALYRAGSNRSLYRL